MSTIELPGSFSDAEESSSRSVEFYSTNGDTFDDYRFACCDFAGSGQSRRNSSEYSVEVEEIRVCLDREERDCRICHFRLDSECELGGGDAIELGCSCKDDLAAAHKHCAESWFKIKGNKICEICKTIAQNVAGPNDVGPTIEQTNENSNAVTNENRDVVLVDEPLPPLRTSEVRRFWNGHRFLNFLLGCMVFAFVISWLFHFNVPS